MIKRTTITGLFVPRGTLPRSQYAVIGAVLAIVKINVDRAIAGLYGRYWDPVEYWIPSGAPLRDLGRGDLTLYATLAAVAVPFVWVGVALTLRRLRDAGLPGWLVLLFFVPFLNLLLFLVLCAVPPSEDSSQGGRASSRLDRILPRGRANYTEAQSASSI